MGKKDERAAQYSLRYGSRYNIGWKFSIRGISRTLSLSHRYSVSL
jgi:hypothetical protein